ncbi:MAG: CHASE2 domain-containing protein, partial [Cyanobacteria bacterium P01_H01_bin.153]
MRNRLSHIREQFNAWQTRWRSLRWAEQRLTPGLAAALCGMALFAAGAWEPVERLVYTGLFAVRDRVNPIEWDDRLVVIAIDEESLATYGTYPWSRERYTDLLNQLMPAQPAAIGFDILMPQSTPQDAPFAESIRFSSNVVLAVGSDAAGKSIQVAPSLLGPTDGFVRIGHIKHRPDADGLSRQAFLYEIHGTNVTSSFGIALLEAYQQSLESLITTEPLDIPNVNPVFVTHRGQFDQDHPVWINWPGSTHSFTSDRTTEAGLTTFSFAQVMAINDSQALAQFQNKIVLVGYTAAGVVGNTEDALRTPFDRQTPTAGVYLHAAVVDNLLRDRFLTRLPLWWTLLLLLASGIGSSLILKPLQVRGRMLVIFGFMPLWFALAYGSFLAGVWIPVAAPVATSVFGLLASQFVEQR